MKKFFALALALVMICALSVTCFATTLTDTNNTGSAEVKVSYSDGADAPATYVVEVVWEELSFTYSQAPQKWNEVTHEEEDDGESRWLDNDAVITITNHSNEDVWVTVEYEPGTASGTVDFDLTDNGSEIKFEAAAGNDVDSKEFTLTVSGIPAETAAGTVVGSVTVTIATEATPANPV